MARLNNKPLSTNPKGRHTAKANRWVSGWIAADTVIEGMTAWDREIDLIESIMEGLK